MPEGDTVYRTATKLRETLTGRTLTRCDVRVPKFATVDLSGCVVDEVVSRGKHLFIRVGDASIHSHLKMDGAWLVGGQIRRIQPHKIRIILETADSRAAGIDLGVLEILKRDHDMDTVAHLGPDLLGDDWEPGVAKANLVSDPQRPLAEALLDQRVMAGVGNVYANELCFVTGYLPTTPVGTVKDPLRMVQRAASGSLWTYADDERAGAVGQARSTNEVSEQRRPIGHGGD
ncbi:MAG: DNA-formamidopyrimidine glycosylase family protein, partial [Mycobacterium sp.]